jgi:putative heme-binding domain-containing protein
MLASIFVDLMACVERIRLGTSRKIAIQLNVAFLDLKRQSQHLTVRFCRLGRRISQVFWHDARTTLFRSKHTTLRTAPMIRLISSLATRWQYVMLLAVMFAFFASRAFAEDTTDVTSVVTAAVKDNKLSISADNQTFGDTAPGTPKSLHIEYRIGDEKLKRDANEGERVEITVPADKKFVITKAIYGPSDGSKVFTVGKPEEFLDTLPGFKIEHVLQANAKTNGSWISMTKDPKGRLLLGGQRGQAITRVTLNDGKVAKEEFLQIPITEAMGMLFVDNVLYVNGAGKDGKFCLFRCKDTKGNNSYDDVEMLREWQGGAGEHGAHGIVLGPDKKLYIVCGNFVDVPKDLAPSSPHRNYADDLAINRAEDGNGFGAGRLPPGGFVARLDLDGKNAELYSSGQRNTYDIDFNADGELFGFDSDMEWDWGAPWYRPIHVFHSVRGGDQGFREGSAKWPEYYQDSLPQTTTIGIGCPTGVTFGTGAKFPVKYQKAIYVCDWTYGRLIAVHLTPKGAGYTGTWENFVAPQSLRTNKGKSPLNLTDAVIGDDGAMYFTVGGRGTPASLYRVTYIGNEPAKALPASELRNTEGSETRELRHKLETFNVKADPAAVEFAWPHLSSPDRYIRYAARLAVERNPVSQWQAKALAEKQPDAAFTALLALARLGTSDTQPAIFNALATIPAAGLTEDQQLEKLRVIEVSLARQGIPTGEVAQRLIAEINPLFPAKTDSANRELSQILLALNAPDAVAKTIALLKSATTQEEQVALVMNLRNIKTGWNVDLRRTYLSWWNAGRSTKHPDRVVKWFADAGIPFNNGASFSNFLSHAHEEAKFAMSPEEIIALNDLLVAYSAAQAPKPAPALATRKLVKEWTTADLQPLLDQVSKGRNFGRGKEIFYQAQCSACHRYGDQGGAIGPDLTAVATRYKRQDLLEASTEPSKVVSEQYMNTSIETNDGKVFVGRILEETKDKVVLRPNPLEATTITIKKSDIETRQLSKISPMPTGLLNTFTKDEILDLLAYLESLGNSKHPNFGK